MTKKERLYFGGITEKTRICANCEYYHPHFIKKDGGFFLLSIGHCVYPRMKNRSAYDDCKYFEQKDKDGV